MRSKRIPLAAAAFAASVSLACAAGVPPKVQQVLYDNGHWSVAGSSFADGNKQCLLINTQQTAGGETDFAFSDFRGRGSIIMFHDTTTTWDASSGSVTIQIDSNPSFIAKTETDTTHNVLIVPLADTPAPLMTAFLGQLAAGHEMHLVASVKTLTFDLSGNNQALAVFGRCISAMSPDSH
jgi:hypothetical protein